MSTEEVQEEITDVSAWKKGRTGRKVVTLPSGMKVRLRVIGMETFVTSGAIPNSLMKLVTDQLEKGKKGKPEDVDPAAFIKDLQDDPQKLSDLVELVDRVAIRSFVAPKLHPVPDNEDDRSDDKLYVDEVDSEDKFFVFNYASGGSDDLEQFREEVTSGVEAVSDGGEVSQPA